MSSRIRPRRSGIIHLDIKMRRMARRAAADRPQSPETKQASPPDTRTPSSDIGAERDLILERIAELRAELAEQERHLQAIDLLLAADPAARIKDRREANTHRRPSDLLDVEYTVVSRVS